MPSVQVGPRAGFIDCCALRRVCKLKAVGCCLPVRSHGLAAFCKKRAPSSLGDVPKVCSSPSPRQCGAGMPTGAAQSDFLSVALQLLLALMVQTEALPGWHRLGCPCTLTGCTHLAKGELTQALRDVSGEIGLENLASCWEYLPLGPCVGHHPGFQSATCLSITEPGGFPPNRTFGHCLKGTGAEG